MRWIIRIGGSLIVASALILVGLMLLPGDRVASLLAEQVRAQTGRTLTIEGDVRTTIWPVLGIETGPVTLSNAEWTADAPMLRAEGLSVGIATASLLSGDLRFKQIIADRPVLRLEHNGERGNWQFESVAKEVAGTTAPDQNSTPDADRQATLERLEFRNARLIYADRGQPVRDLSDVTVTASWPDITAPLRVNAVLPVGQDHIEVDLQLPDLLRFADGKVAGMDVSLTGPGTDIKFSGQVNSQPELAGKLSMSSGDTARLFTAFGLSEMKLPDGLGQSVDLNAEVTYTRDGMVSLRDLDLQLDRNRITGEADISLEDTPRVVARLATGDLDLRGLQQTNPSSGSATTQSELDGWSTEPIDVSALALIEGTIGLTARSIVLPDLTLGESKLALSVERRRAVLRLQKVNLFSGQVTGQLVANNRNGLSVGGDIRADQIDLQQALSSLAGIERLSGPVSGRLKFLGVGQNEDQIMRSLSGDGEVNAGRGVISGIDLDQLMGTGEGEGGTTVYNSLTGRFQIENGDLRTSDLLIQLDNFRVDGAGRVGLGARDLDVLLTPVALRANGGQGLAVPVQVVGPWTDPSIRPDLRQAIEALADTELDALEDQAKDTALQKLTEELDTEITEDQDIEELIKDRLEEEAKKELRKLFGFD